MPALRRFAPAGPDFRLFRYGARNSYGSLTLSSRLNSGRRPRGARATPLWRATGASSRHMVTILVTAKQIAGHRLLTRLQPLGHYADPRSVFGKTLRNGEPRDGGNHPGAGRKENCAARLANSHPSTRYERFAVNTDPAGSSRLSSFSSRPGKERIRETPLPFCPSLLHGRLRAAAPPWASRVSPGAPAGLS